MPNTHDITPYDLNKAGAPPTSKKESGVRKRAPKRGFRYWSGRLHLWLGLASSIVVLIVSLTGCVFAFQKEISEWLHPEWFFHAPPVASGIEGAGDGVVAHTVPLSAMVAKAQAVLGKDRPVENITSYKDAARNWEFMAYKVNDTALTYFGAVEYFRSVFINPYTGEVAGQRDYKYDFFNVLKYLHWSLLLNTPYGQPIVGWSTLIFVILLITGLVLWWPKKWNKANRDRSFRIKWKARFKRVNYDLHNVPGFYTLLLALILGLTGLVFAFQWFSALVYAAAAGTTKPPETVTMKSVKPVKPKGSTADSVGLNDRAVAAAVPANGAVHARTAVQPIDIAFEGAWQAMPDAKRVLISPAAGPEGVVYAFGYKLKECYYGTDQLQFDQYTGKLLNRRNDSAKNRGEKLVERNYDIHVGAIAGLPGKIIAFIISLVCASLPVTGFLIWWGRQKKSKHPIRNKITIIEKSGQDPELSAGS